MNRKKLKKAIICVLIGLVLFFILYSVIFRAYFNPDEYLNIAYEYTNRDPHILNWQEPDFEIIQHKGILSIHITFHTDQDETRGPYSLYIDPFKKVVFDADRRR
jgi:hypothetical protein